MQHGVTLGRKRAAFPFLNSQVKRKAQPRFPWFKLEPAPPIPGAKFPAGCPERTQAAFRRQRLACVMAAAGVGVYSWPSCFPFPVSRLHRGHVLSFRLTPFSSADRVISGRSREPQSSRLDTASFGARKIAVSIPRTAIILSCDSELTLDDPSSLCCSSDPDDVLLARTANRVFFSRHRWPDSSPPQSCL